MSAAVPVRTKSALRESQDLISSTSRLIFTDSWHDHGNSIGSRTAHDQSKMKTSEIPGYMQTTKITPHTSSIDNPSLTVGHLQFDSIGKMSRGETRISSAKNVILPIGIRTPISHLTSQTAVKRETANSASLLNLVNITANTPMRGDSVMRSKQPLHISQTLISEDGQKNLLFHDNVVNAGHDSTLKLSEAHQLSSAAEEMTSQTSVTPMSSVRDTSTQNISLPLGAVSQFTSQRIVKTEAEDSLLLNSRKFTTNMPLRGDTEVYSNHVSEDARNTLILPDDAVTRDTGHYSTSYKPAMNFQMPVSARLQKVPAVASKLQTLSHESTVVAAHGWFSLSWLQSTASQETTSQSSVVPMSNIRDTSAQNIRQIQLMLQRNAKTQSQDSFLLNSRNIATTGGTSLRDDSVMPSKQPRHTSQKHVSEDVQETSVLPGVLLKLSTIAAEVDTLHRKSSAEVPSGTFSLSLPQLTTTQETTVESSVTSTSSSGNVAEMLPNSEYCYFVKCTLLL